MNTLDMIVCRHLSRLIDDPAETPGIGPEAIDLDADLFDSYGLTSLTMMLLITSICEEAQIDLSLFTEDDLANLRTLRAVAGRIEPGYAAAARVER
jgi:acyl carrier protein